MTQKSNFPDTPWHVGSAKKDSDDPRRHRSRCIYYSDGCCCCGKSGCYKMKCGGSAHCLFYEEYPLSNNHIYRAGHIKSHTASEKAALTAHYKELNEAEEKLFLRKEVSCFHSLDSISFNEEPDSLFCYHVLKKDGSEVKLPAFEIGVFQDGITQFRYQNKYGIIDDEANIVVPNQYDY